MNRHTKQKQKIGNNSWKMVNPVLLLDVVVLSIAVKKYLTTTHKEWAKNF